MRYELLFEKGNYALILRKQNLNEYAVVYGLDKEAGDWGHTVAYYGFGEFCNMSQAEALQRAIDVFRAKTEEKYISRSRLIELGTLFKDGLLQDDKDSAMEYFEDTMELTDEEREFFGIPLELNPDYSFYDEDDGGDGWEDDSDRGCKDCPPDECTGNCMSCYYRPV